MPAANRQHQGPLPDYLVIVDFEATCNDSNGGKNPPPTPQEIIEFPAVLLNVKTREIEDEFHQYILPDVHPKLSEFCTQLTGITQETVNQGISLQDAIRVHSEWLLQHNLTNDVTNKEKGKSRFLYVTCGNWDFQTCLANQMAYHNQEVPKPFSSWVNIKNHYSNFYQRKGRGMAGILKELDLPLEGRHHSGIDDSRNIARICARMLEDGWNTTPRGPRFQGSQNKQQTKAMEAQSAMENMQLSSPQDDNDEWEAVPTKNSKNRRNKKGNQFAQWSSPPLMVEPIPPSPQTSNFSPFMILLIGLPGSGKSTFSNLLMQAMPYKFARVNQDQLGSRKKCIAAANKALDEKKCVILDRCNFDAAQRATWFDLCKKRQIPIYGLALQVPKQLCIQRCQGRGTHETIAPKDAAKVVNIVSKGFQLPSPEEQEQFRSYRTIQNSGMLDDALLQFLNQNE